ncbi:CRISPR-associated protein Cas4 [Thermosipho africanus]|nr:CRISPR-associated protein Cas4 [Thermosipho africanus]
MKILNVGGTLIWYYLICKREVWLMTHEIVPDQYNENIDLGRFIHEFYYKRDKKEIRFGNVVFDILYEKNNRLIIGETKKSSKFSEASKWQLIYYLKILKDAGIIAEGMLSFPEERKKIEVKLSAEAELELEKILKDIDDIINQPNPPKVSKNNFCKNCGYKEYCFS